MSWFKTPLTPQSQLLPKDLLEHARKISGDEIEAHVLNAIKNSTYSYSSNTSQWNPTAWLGSSTSIQAGSFITANITDSIHGATTMMTYTYLP